MTVDYLDAFSNGSNLFSLISVRLFRVLSKKKKKLNVDSIQTVIYSFVRWKV